MLHKDYYQNKVDRVTTRSCPLIHSYSERSSALEIKNSLK